MYTIKTIEVQSEASSKLSQTVSGVLFQQARSIATTKKRHQHQILSSASLLRFDAARPLRIY